MKSYIKRTQAEKYYPVMLPVLRVGMVEDECVIEDDQHHRIVCHAQDGIDSEDRSIRHLMDLPYDYLLTTRADIYSQAVAEGKNIIVPSSVSKGGRGNVRILNYANWIEVDERTHDSSAVMALKLMQACGVAEVLLAGFDGFSVNINENYYDPNMRRPVNAEQAERRNAYYKGLISRVRESGVKIEFVTSSRYE